MEFSTKYSIGQKVWFFASDGIQPFTQGKVSRISIDEHGLAYLVSYSGGNQPKVKTLNEDKIYSTAKALADDLYEQVRYRDEADE